MNTDTMHTTANTGAGRVRKVMTIRTSEEVKMARIQEKQEMMLAKRRALLDAVEQAVDVFYLYPTSWEATDEDGLVNTIDNASMRAKAPSAYEEQASCFEA